MPENSSIVALLDDEPRMRKALQRLLAAHGFRVESYESGRAFLDAQGSQAADCLLLDLQMPETNGFDVLREIGTRHVTTPVIVVTAHGGPDTEERVRALGASDYLTKPVDETRLLAAIHNAILDKSQSQN
jgi:FixJ family two-component response regulator